MYTIWLFIYINIYCISPPLSTLNNLITIWWIFYVIHTENYVYYATHANAEVTPMKNQHSDAYSPDTNGSIKSIFEIFGVFAKKCSSAVRIQWDTWKRFSFFVGCAQMIPVKLRQNGLAWIENRMRQKNVKKLWLSTGVLLHGGAHSKSSPLQWISILKVHIILIIIANCKRLLCTEAHFVWHGIVCCSVLCCRNSWAESAGWEKQSHTFTIENDANKRKEILIIAWCHIKP